MPKSAKSTAVCMPPMPPPITNVDFKAGYSILLIGSRSFALSIEDKSIALAFSVASFGVDR